MTINFRNSNTGRPKPNPPSRPRAKNMTAPDRDYLIGLTKKVKPIKVAPLKMVNDHMKEVERLQAEYKEKNKS